MNKFAQLTFVLILLTFSTNVLAQNITFESAKAKYDGHSYLAAAKDLQQLVKTKAFKKDAQAWNYLGLSYRGAGERKKSLKAFKKAVQLAPTDTVVRLNYSVLVSEAKDPKALREI
jgi:predicted Zn-dependent protease